MYKLELVSRLKLTSAEQLRDTQATLCFGLKIKETVSLSCTQTHTLILTIHMSSYCERPDFPSLIHVLWSVPVTKAAYMLTVAQQHHINHHSVKLTFSYHSFLSVFIHLFSVTLLPVTPSPSSNEFL